MKSVSFGPYVSSSEAASRAKRANPGKDTKPEIVLRHILWRLGLRYRKNVASLPGKPDIVFPGPRVVVFCDGDFWHGKDWERLSEKLGKGSNATYWVEKIRTNRERDRQHDLQLHRMGWKVLRFWESEIRSDPHQVAEQVLRVIRESQSSQWDD